MSANAPPVATDWKQVATTHAKANETLKAEIVRLKAQIKAEQTAKSKFKQDNEELRFFLQDADNRLRAAGLTK